MSTEITLEIERETLESLAQERGFKSVGDYLLSLVAADAADDDEVDVAENLREALRDLKAERVYPLQKLWDLDDIED